MPRWRRHQNPHNLRADDARRHPRVWIEVGVYNSRSSAQAAARSITRADLRHYAPAGAFEARVDLATDGTAVYARYIGETK